MSDITDYLLSPDAIRERTNLIYQRAKEGKTHFKLNEQKLPKVCDFVLEVIKDNYPSLEIPFHSRWGHFKVGGMDRVLTLEQKIESFDKLEKARIKLDLVITSVLLDAGAGPDWKYKEAEYRFSDNRGGAWQRPDHL